MFQAVKNKLSLQCSKKSDCFFLPGHLASMYPKHAGKTCLHDYASVENLGSVSTNSACEHNASAVYETQNVDKLL